MIREIISDLAAISLSITKNGTLVLIGILGFLICRLLENIIYPEGSKEEFRSASGISTSRFFARVISFFIPILSLRFYKAPTEFFPHFEYALWAIIALVLAIHIFIRRTILAEWENAPQRPSD